MSEYPTAYAYEKVCEALHAREAEVKRLRTALEEIADGYERHNPGWWIKKAKAALLDIQPPSPAAPTTFLFGFDDPFEDGGLYVWIVGKEFFEEEGYVDDSSSASSVIPPSKREALTDQTDENGWDLMDKATDEANTWLHKATKGILYGEGMESCWATAWESDYSRELSEQLGTNHIDRYEGKTREEAKEEIKAALIERGFIYEPELEA